MLTPLLSLIVSIKNYKSGWSKNIIWAFTIFYGFTFTITSDNSKSDINRYIRWFHEMRETGMTLNDLLALMYVDEDYADLLQPLLTLIVSRLTDNAAWLLAAFGLIFGYFYSRNIWFVIERLKGKIGSRIIILLAVFALIVPIWNINGFRFWTATHIFVFSLLHIIYERKKGYFVLLLSTVFVHFSFILPVCITLSYFVAGNRLTAYFYFFVVSFFITEINTTALSTAAMSVLPDIFVARSEGYISGDGSEDTVNQQAKKQELSENRAWYAIFYMKALNWAITAYLAFIFYYCKKIYNNNVLFKKMLSFIFYFYAVANILSLIPSGRRFVMISNLIAMVVIIFHMQYVSSYKKSDFLFKVSLPFLILFSVVSLRNSFKSIGIITITGNPIVAMFITEDTGVANLSE